ncbi:MAG: hypothetical protein ACR2OE_12750 [Thermomicrobiales bacterium]
MNNQLPHRSRPNLFAGLTFIVNWAQSRRNIRGYKRNQRWTALVAVIVASLVLTACGGNSSGVKEDRQFASNATSGKHEEPTMTPTATTISSQATTAVSTASPGILLKTRGAPSTSYVFLNNKIIALSPGSHSATPIAIEIPKGQRLLGYDSSPSGDRVALVTAPKSPAADGSSPTTLFIYGRDGKQFGSSRALFVLAKVVATPVPGAIPAMQVSVSWSAQGDQILVSSPAGQVVTVPVEGDPQPIAIAGIKGTVLHASWSPRGGSVLLVIRDEKQHGSIALVTLKAFKGKIQTIWPRSDEAHLKSVEAAEWLPDGSGVMFTQSEIQDGAPVEAQLFELLLIGKGPVVIATAGRAGPSAAISAFAISPDGKSVAYTIVRPNGNGWTFHSMWVRSIREGTIYPVPVLSSAFGVSDLKWSRAGIVWKQDGRDVQDHTVTDVMLAGHDGSITVLATTRMSLATPSPGASPLPASPGATPA